MQNVKSGNGIINIIFKKLLTSKNLFVIICFALRVDEEYAGIAQLARACGSYPQCRWFKSDYRYQRPVGQVVKTPPFHGSNMGSSPVRVTKNKHPLSVDKGCLFFYPSLRLDKTKHSAATMSKQIQGFALFFLYNATNDKT